MEVSVVLPWHWMQPRFSFGWMKLSSDHLISFQGLFDKMYKCWCRPCADWFVLLTHLPTFFFSSVFSEIFQVSERFYICVWVETCRVNCLVWFGKNWHKICEYFYYQRWWICFWCERENGWQDCGIYERVSAYCVLNLCIQSKLILTEVFLSYPVQKNRPHPLPQRKIGVKWRVRWNTWQMTLSKDSWRKRNMSWSCFMHHVSWISERVTTISFHGTLIQRV